MPSYNDYDPNDPDSGGTDDSGSSAPASGSAGAPRQADPSKQQDSSYIPWSSFQSANSAVDQREANNLSNQVSTDESNATKQLATDEHPNSTTPSSDTVSSPATKSASGDASLLGADTTPYGPQDNAGTATSKTDDTSDNTSTVTDSNVPTTAPTVNPWASLSTPSSTGDSGDGTGGPASTPTVNPTAPGGNTTSGRAPPVMNAAGVANQTAAANNTRVTGIVPSVASQPPAPQTPAQPALAPAAAPATGPGPTAPGVGIPGLVNGPDLQTAIGPAAWASLVGNTDRAQQEANALGQGQNGVQALLQANSGQVDNGGVNSGFDAALINGVGGNGQFQQTAQAGKNLDQNVINADQASQNAWATLQAKDAAAAQPVASVVGTINPATPSASSPSPDWVPTSPLEGSNNPGDITSTGQGPIQTLANGPQSAWQSFVGGNGAAGSDPTGPPVFNTSPDPTGATASVSADGSINIPGNKYGYDWSEFWGVPGLPSSNAPDPATAGFTSAQWQNLVNMTPAQRTAWWNANHKG